MASQYAENRNLARFANCNLRVCTSLDFFPLSTDRAENARLSRGSVRVLVLSSSSFPVFVLPIVLTIHAALQRCVRR
jgi:hypothetical protein